MLKLKNIIKQLKEKSLYCRSTTRINDGWHIIGTVLHNIIDSSLETGQILEVNYNCTHGEGGENKEM